MILVIGILWDPLAATRERSVEGLVPPAPAHAQVRGN
jgi:hypothetical protein